MLNILKILGLITLSASSIVCSSIGKNQIQNITPGNDYLNVDFNDDIKGGVKITCSRDTENNDFSEMTMTFPNALDFSTQHAFTMKMKSISTGFPFFFNVFDENDNSIQLPANNDSTKRIYHVDSSGVVYKCLRGGNPNTIKYESNTSGTLVFPLDSMIPLSGTIDYTKIKKIKISIAVFYDYDFACCFGDIGVIDDDGKWSMKFDCSEYKFNEIYAITAFPEYMNISEVKNSGKATWMGDAKIINELNYASTEELQHAVTWNSGDNVCSYWQEDDAMRVHIGPYEIGHTYGSYMCLKISNSDALDDYDFTRDVDGETSYAKGLTMFVKNCSRKEIGINLQFDELTQANTYERWIMKGYPAMYYAWDVIKNEEYVFYSKSDQFQIPVGFEGYVRIPFDQLQVPDWNIGTDGVDQELDLSRFNKEFYLTSDNTRYEDLEFLIKNIGVYFNDTYKANLFDNSHGIKSNMGL